MAFLDTIDISKFDEQYDELVKKIDEIVASTQGHPEQPLPSIMWLTKKQQKMLRRYPQCKNMYGTTAKYWLTPMNVMECVVK